MKKCWHSFSADEPRESSACFKINSQIPCPPRGTVPDNQGRGLTGVISTQRAQFAFGHGCDPASYIILLLFARPTLLIYFGLATVPFTPCLHSP
jgi:hypothetical protein